MPRRGALAITGARASAVAAVLLATLLGGWLWGASGRSDLVRALRTAESRRNLLEARASVLGARVSLCDADLDGVSRQLEDARAFVGASLSGPRADPEMLRDLAGLLSGIGNAQRLADAAAADARNRLPRTPGTGRPSRASAPPVDVGPALPAPVRAVSNAPSREPSR